MKQVKKKIMLHVKNEKIAFTKNLLKNEFDQSTREALLNQM